MTLLLSLVAVLGAVAPLGARAVHPPFELGGDLSADTLGLLERQEWVVHATHAPEPAIPINSEGPHVGARKVADVVLLFAFLVVPFVMWGALKVGEIAAERRAASQQAAEGKQDGSIQRLGSNYQLQESSKAGSAISSLRPSSAQEADEGTILQNALAGFSTAMAALPDAISFSFITGVSPLNGIWAGCIMGITVALVGGRPGMISSASAATAVVLAHVSLDPKLGMGPMALCVFIVGVLQIIAAALRLSRFITMIPHSVMTGFVNGLAIVMVRAQLRQYHYHGDGPWVEKEMIASMTITALFAMASAVVWARIPVIGKVLPPPLASVILTTVFSIVCASFLPRRTLGDVAGESTFRGGFNTMPSWDFPPTGVQWHDGAMWGKVISTAVRFAIVGLLESLMTQALIDQITGTSGSMRRECFGQGVGNIISALFGTQGGCALIAQSLLNVSSGGRSRVSGLVMGITLGLSVLLLAPVMKIIPVAALVGLITLIALNTFAWSSLALVLRINWVDAIVVVLVTVVTVWQDLCVAVVIGVVLCGLGFAWTSATDVRVETREDKDKPNEKTYVLRGPLFFGSAMNYKNGFSTSSLPEDVVVLDFSSSRILDISGVKAIEETRDFLCSKGKKVVLRGVPSEALRHIAPNAETIIEDGGSKDGQGKM
eukprot:CAMPEP_0204517342 /NCGR_PEP_ID=MMETSP0661-20131031/3613_1 /ASSEMBLY_ACC=CAM_ASM_000606 /TAXON_ID=109239 /ORGANISM="Alexandrium margalefi, Strain AMGDE01CS-322" /LENGTH=659 /DNA_ID=CAMNT_0051522737 /DNA_START=82 /DNA_END=2061 /DNA_ORIENTATION=-